MRFRWLSLLFPVRLALAVLLIFFLWHAWVFLRPRPELLSAAELNALRMTVRTAAQTVRDAKPEAHLRVGVTHFVNDPTDAVTELVRTEFDRLPDITVETGSPIQKFLRDIGRAISEATSMDEIVHAARRVDLDLIIGGRVLQTMKDPESQEARAVIQVAAYDAREGGWLLRETFEGTWQPHLGDKVTERILGLSARGRFILWLAVVLALPWATYWGTHWALQRRNNLASFILIMAYTVAGLLLAVALSGFRVVGAGDWWRMLGALIFAAGYNYWACENIAGKTK